MSIEAMNAVFDHSRTVGNARMVMTIIANAANPAGWDSFQFQDTIAAKAGHIAIRTVEKCVKAAVDLGELEVHRPDRTKSNRYSVMLPGLAIFDDPEERVRRDEIYAGMALGRAAKTEQNRANRRSEDPHVRTGPIADDPNERAGGTRTEGRVGPEHADGSDPNERAGLLKESLNTTKQPETPVKEIALAAEGLWNCYPHHRRDLDPARTLDKLTRLNAGDVTSIDKIAGALAEDLESRDWRENFIPKMSKWLDDRQWDRPLVNLVDLNPLAGIEVSGPDPEFDRVVRASLGDDVADIWISQCWHGRRGETYILGGTDRACSWLELRYGRVLARVAQSLDYDGLDIVAAAQPQTKEIAAA